MIDISRYLGKPLNTVHIRPQNVDLCVLEQKESKWVLTATISGRPMAFTFDTEQKARELQSELI